MLVKCKSGKTAFLAAAKELDGLPAMTNLALHKDASPEATIRTHSLQGSECEGRASSLVPNAHLGAGLLQSHRDKVQPRVRPPPPRARRQGLHRPPPGHRRHRRRLQAVPITPFASFAPLAPEAVSP